MTITKVRAIGPQDGARTFLGTVGVRFMLDAADTGGGFSLVEHPMGPRALAAPLHRHHNEDEYSYVLSGRIGALLGDDVLEAGPGDLVLKPRGEWHTFWTAGDEPARVLEIISPGGFEEMFRALGDLGGLTRATPEQMMALSRRFSMDVDPGSIPGLCERFGLRFPGDEVT